jgi:DNA-binding transcriptional LysR family regulator
MRYATLKQLRAFAAVTRTGSVTRAAELLHISPPAVTLQMKLLHEQLGVPLVERAAAGLAPTQAGRLLQDAVRRIEAILSDTEAGIATLAGAESGSVRVGVVSTGKYFAPRVLAAFVRAFPRIDLRLTVGNRAEIIAGLREHELDLAVMGRPPEGLEVEMAEIGPHPHVVVLPSEHALARRRGLAPRELAGETFLVREPGSGTRMLMERFFQESHIGPRIGMEIGSNETIKQAVMAGLGVAFLSAHTIEMEVGVGRLTVADVQGLPVVRQWNVVALAGRRLMPAAETLRRFFAREARALLPRLPLSGYDGESATALATAPAMIAPPNKPNEYH